MSDERVTLESTFDALADEARAHVEGGEELSLWFDAESSSFVRLNHARIRQPGDVVQRSLWIDLRRGKRHAAGTLGISGDRTVDEERLGALVRTLRESLPMLPEDPYLNVPDEVRSSEHWASDALPDPHEATHSILRAAEGLDLVGILAQGGVHAGYADTRGQRNWFSSYSFHFDFSVYLRADKAVKQSYAGFAWDDEAMAAKIASARTQLEHLQRDARDIRPGRYRVYLTPAAMNEVLGLVGWNGFGIKNRQTKQSSLLRMSEQGATLHPSVHLVENAAEGVGPTFSRQGFVKPARVELLREGRLGDPLVSARSAKEYGAACTAHGLDETPEALHMAGGTLDAGRALEALGEGVWISNLWYLNFSDRPACRITGMTRFATFWVEGGRIVAPLNVMRFDETLYRALGENLEALTQERELLLDAQSYQARSTRSALLPGALVRDFTFTL